MNKYNIGDEVYLYDFYNKITFPVKITHILFEGGHLYYKADYNHTPSSSRELPVYLWDKQEIDEDFLSSSKKELKEFWLEQINNIKE